MQKRALLLAMVIAIAAAFVWFAKTGSPPVLSAGVGSLEDLTRAEKSPTVEALAQLALGADATASSSEADASQQGLRGDRVAATTSSGNDETRLVLPSRIRWVDELTLEPLPFLVFIVTDAEGEKFPGESDENGWCSVPPEMTPGPVKVMAISSTRVSSDSSRRATPDDYMLALADGETECVWSFPATRSVPLRVSVDAEGVGPIELHDLDTWISCSSAEGSNQADWMKYRLSPLLSFNRTKKRGHLLGATHAIRLASVSDPIRRQLPPRPRKRPDYPACWHHEKAATSLAGRALLLVTVVDGITYVGELVTADFPRLGQPPLDVVLRPQPAAQLPSDKLSALYSSEEVLQQAELARTAAEKARPIYRLKGVLQSNSGAYQGQVAIRANPAERNNEGGHDLRQQWISADWQEVSPGQFEAPFELDRLDGGEYWVHFIPQDGAAVSERKVAIDTTAPSLDPLVVTILD
jgi:hypothetical protein